MEVYECLDHLDYLKFMMKKGNSGKMHGSVKALAEALRCHPTFVSQVLHGKAFLSMEQAVRVGSYYQMPKEEIRYFIDLLNRDKAGTLEAKNYFQAILDEQLESRKSFQKRTRLATSLQKEQEMEYLASWIPSALHAGIHIFRLQTLAKITSALGLSETIVEEKLELLKKIGLALPKGKRWLPTQNALHLSKESTMAGNYHGQWRIRTQQKLLNEKRNLDQTHFSSVFAIDKKTAEEIRELLLKGLESARKKMVDAPSEHLYTLCLDFYPLTNL